jgi:hypothetical protein
MYIITVFNGQMHNKSDFYLFILSDLLYWLISVGHLVDMTLLEVYSGGKWRRSRMKYEVSGTLFNRTSLIWSFFGLLLQVYARTVHTVSRARWSLNTVKVPEAEYLFSSSLLFSLTL